MKFLRIYPILTSISTGLVNPFMSFFTASLGDTGESLAVVSSAGTAFPGVVQFLMSFLRFRTRLVLSISNVLIGLIWLLVSLTYFSPFTYVIVESLAGASAIAWSVVAEDLSRGSRGLVLSGVMVYSSVGSIAATVITGLIVGPQLGLMRYFFLASGIIFLSSGLISALLSPDLQSEGGRRFNVSREFRKFLLVSSIFTFVWSTAWPLFPLAQVYKFHMTEANLAILDLISASTSILLRRRIGSMTDTRRRQVMFAGRLLLATFPFSYAFLTSTYQLYLTGLVSGFTNAAGISYTAYLYDSEGDRAKKIGLYSACNGVAALTGSSLSSAVLSILVSQGLPILEVVLDLLVVIGLARVVASFMYLSLKVPEVPPRNPKFIR